MVMAGVLDIPPLQFLSETRTLFPLLVVDGPALIPRSRRHVRLLAASPVMLPPRTVLQTVKLVTVISMMTTVMIIVLTTARRPCLPVVRLVPLRVVPLLVV